MRDCSGFGVEVDAIPGGFVCSGTAQVRRSTPTTIAPGRRRWRPLRKLFTKQQRALYEEHAPDGIALDDLSVLGPIFVLKLKLQPRDSRASSSRRCGCTPTASRILELSTKCLPTEAFQVAAETRAYLAEHGIDLGGDQQTKTRNGARVLRRRARGAVSPPRA